MSTSTQNLPAPARSRGAVSSDQPRTRWWLYGVLSLALLVVVAPFV